MLPINSSDQSSKKVLKISVLYKQIIRTAVESFFPSTCYITSSGYSDSLRSLQDGFFRIGRQQITETGVRPNDLMLPPSDRAISRSHCMINYKEFFNKEIPTNWMAFLMAFHPRLGEQSILKFLPIEIVKHIISFLKFERLPLLIDLGSMCGTYVKVSNIEPIHLINGLSLIVGSDIIIEIDRVVNEFKDFDELFKNDGNNTINGFNYNLPFVIIKVSKAFSDQDATMSVQTYKFEANKENLRFTIGRSQSCDININENTISRIQCRVIFYEKKWVIFDGSEGKPTVNGTWLSICKRTDGLREESEPFELTNGSQIKVSDTILEVCWA